MSRLLRHDDQMSWRAQLLAETLAERDGSNAIDAAHKVIDRSHICVYRKGGDKCVVGQSQREVLAVRDKGVVIAMLNFGVHNCLEMLPTVANIVITIEIDWQLLCPISVSSLENVERTLPNATHDLGIVGIVPGSEQSHPLIVDSPSLFLLWSFLSTHCPCAPG